MGYLFGTINPSYIISHAKGFDIRKRGSHNAGASNAVILMGKRIGIFCALIDILKACLAIALAKKFFPDFRYACILTGAGCIVGHIFPYNMEFRGGKGLACLGGMILMYDWRVFFIFLTAEIVIALITNYVCFVPITASAAFSITYGFLTRDIFGVIILTAITCLIIYKHIENIRRIKNGTEMRLSYLWNKDAEIKRLEKNDLQN